MSKTHPLANFGFLFWTGLWLMASSFWQKGHLHWPGWDILILSGFAIAVGAASIAYRRRILRREVNTELTMHRVLTALKR